MQFMLPVRWRCLRGIGERRCTRKKGANAHPRHLLERPSHRRCRMASLTPRDIFHLTEATPPRDDDVATRGRGRGARHHLDSIDLSLVLEVLSSFFFFAFFPSGASKPRRRCATDVC